MPTMLIAIASDHAGFELKEQLEAALVARSITVEDLGTHDAASTDYPDYAHRVADGVASGKWERGILVCGTGVGMAISANRHKGVRAVVCSEPYTARLSRQHNDSNVLCMGARVVGPGMALDILDAWLGASFEGGRHAGRVAKIERG